MQTCTQHGLIDMPRAMSTRPLSPDSPWHSFSAAAKETLHLSGIGFESMYGADSTSPASLSDFYYTYREQIEALPCMVAWRAEQAAAAAAAAASGQALVGQAIKRRRLADRADGKSGRVPTAEIIAYKPATGEHLLSFKRNGLRRLPATTEWHDLSQL